MKKGCPLLPMLFGIYIAELESSLREHVQPENGCLIHQVLISILLFADDVVLLCSTLEGLYRQFDALSSFCDLRQLMVNLLKTKVMIMVWRWRSPLLTLAWVFGFEGLDLV